ncbi:MAG: glutamate synthase subunit beta [Desulfosarcinaceae bacterium]
MGKPTGFKEHPRETAERRPVSDRVGDHKEIYLPFPEKKIKQQTARCMDCGVPTCHAGCPLGNLIPDWNDLVYRGNWREAIHRLHQTNNFPEFTGRLCPAPCEEACVLAINEPAVTIEQIEKEIIEHAFKNGWIRPEPPRQRTGKRVAVVGSGPAGLACAAQLNRAGHTVTVFERDDRIGGLLRYGIPDFKLEKRILDRRLDLLMAEGIVFQTGRQAGLDLSVAEIKAFDAAVLCLGATRPRDLPIPGRELAGIYFAMDFLTRQNRVNAGDDIAGLGPISAAGKHVVVIGGGDTGSDCMGTCHRQGAATVTNLELFPQPPEGRPGHQPWPFWPMRLRTSASHEEGGLRRYGLMSKAFEGRNGVVTGLATMEVRFQEQASGPPRMEEIPGTRKPWPADVVLLAMGFAGPETGTIVHQLGLELGPAGNIATDQAYSTSHPGIFAAGDARRGQSLVVWAISEGREAARAVDIFLTGRSALPAKGCCDLPRVP